MIEEKKKKKSPHSTRIINQTTSQIDIHKKMEYKRRKQREIKRKKQRIILTFILLLILLCFITFLFLSNFKKKNIATSSEELKNMNSSNLLKEEKNITNENTSGKITREITDWRLTLANIDSPLPENYLLELADIDKNRQFDKRAISDLKNMMEAAKNTGITNFWVQSSYRSVAKQKELYQNSIQKYINQGKTQEEAEKQTLLFINKPGASEHNLGLAVDFNYVDNDFEKSKAFYWLQKNAEKYGFILRYPKDKEAITKISYEPWHWRYVGQEHAEKIKQLNLCLEEYIEKLKNESV